ncbi:hypothetical protein [Sphingomonas parva]|nr:hypothetical protein [Sphingomonas parva]
MTSPTDSPEELLTKAGTCRRIAEGMGADPLARNLIEIAEDYEARAAELQGVITVIADQPA